MERDEEAFAALRGVRLFSIEFVLDYVQLRFDGATMNLYTAAVARVGADEFRWGEAGYRDALCERIGSTLAVGYSSPDEITLEFSDSAVFTISRREADTPGPEPAELFGSDGLWVWQAGVPEISYFANPS